MYKYVCFVHAIYTYTVVVRTGYMNLHRGINADQRINVDHRINVDKHSKP
jgi:hypothetical protein